MRKIHEASVQRRVVRIQSSDNRPVMSAAMAKANGTVNPMNPRYRNGGWTAMSGWFCSSGSGPAAVERRHRQRGERTGRPQHQQQVERLHAVHHGQDPRQRFGPASPEAERDRRQEARQDQVPQEQRPLVGRPQREHLEERRRLAARVLRHVGDREVVRAAAPRPSRCSPRSAARTASRPRCGRSRPGAAGPGARRGSRPTPRRRPAPGTARARTFPGGPRLACACQVGGRGCLAGLRRLVHAVVLHQDRVGVERAVAPEVPLDHHALSGPE